MPFSYQKLVKSTESLILPIQETTDGWLIGTKHFHKLQKNSTNQNTSTITKHLQQSGSWLGY